MIRSRTQPLYGIRYLTAAELNYSTTITLQTNTQIMKYTHPEFAYQSRELGIQIEDTLGNPPDRKSYERLVKSLIGEFANGSEIDDVNLLSFALVDHLRFNDPAGLLSQCAVYDEGDAEKVRKMVTCLDEESNTAMNAMFDKNPELARKAIITAFLYKNPKRWIDEDNSLDALQKDEDFDDEDEDQMTSGHNIDHLFDERGDENV